MSPLSGVSSCQRVINVAFPQAYRSSESTAHHIYPKAYGAEHLSFMYAEDAGIVALSTMSAWPTSACIVLESS